MLSAPRILSLGVKCPVPDEATQADVVPLLYRAELHRHPEFFALLSDPNLLSAVRVLLPEADRIRVYPNYRYGTSRCSPTTAMVKSGSQNTGSVKFKCTTIAGMLKLGSPNTGRVKFKCTPIAGMFKLGSPNTGRVKFKCTPIAGMFKLGSPNTGRVKFKCTPIAGMFKLGSPNTGRVKFKCTSIAGMFKLGSTPATSMVKSG